MVLLGRDPLRKVPDQSPVSKRKIKYNSTWIPEDLEVLSEEARDHLYQKLNRLHERRPSKDIPSLPGKFRAASVDDEVVVKAKGSPRPGLIRRPFSVAVGMADLFKESDHLKENRPPTKRSISNLTPLYTHNELSSQHSGSDDSISAQGDSSAIDSEYSEVEEPRSRKASSQFGARNNQGRASPNRTKYVVTSSFFAEETGEVSLEEGEEVEVLQKESSGWWYVKNEFCEGWAPQAFLALAGGSRSSSPKTPESPIPPQSLDSQAQSCPLEPKLDSCPEKPDGEEEEKRFFPQVQEKVGNI